MVDKITDIDGYLNLYKKRINLKTRCQYYNYKGIYFLYKDDVVVYVGMSSYSIFNRIWEHQKTKKFDSVYFIETNNVFTKENLFVGEYVYINIFNPKYNKIGKNFDYSDYINDFVNI
jgi:hypothetical protein